LAQANDLSVGRAERISYRQIGKPCAQSSSPWEVKAALAQEGRLPVRS